MIELAPSILSADFAHLADHVHAVAEGGATVARGCNGRTLCTESDHWAVCGCVPAEGNAPSFDVHLMIENPDLFIPSFVDPGADWISVHQEACIHLHRTLELIRSHNVNAGVVINPATPVEMLENILDMVDHVLVMSVNPGFGGQKFIPMVLEKVRRLVAMRSERRANFRIEIDGGIGNDTIADAVRAAWKFLVAGNAVFGKGSAKENTQRLLKLAQEATLQRV